MDDHYLEEYPLLVELLRSQTKDWKWDYQNIELDENIEMLIGKTAWGLLELVEKQLRRLDGLTKEFHPLNGDCKTMFCPYDHDFGCMDGKVCRILQLSDAVKVDQTTLLCRSWDASRSLCIRIDGRSSC